ncbi:MAG: O-antigen ligase family protein [Clostridiales Family XIII bacterium]|jgi:hypothetical protein|nr:O-antigen ligase family protein [Clostridiales Family XIII bacterium]
MAKRKKNKGQNTDAQNQSANKQGAADAVTKKGNTAKNSSPWARGKSSQSGEPDDTASAAQSKSTNNSTAQGTRAARRRSKGQVAAKRQEPQSAAERKKDYIFSMSHAPRLDETPIHWIQFIPAALFTAVVIMLARQYAYARDMSGYYWSNQTTPPTPGDPNLVEFFSHYKVELIGWSVLLMGIMIAYRVVVQQFSVKRTKLYLPMIGYLVFVLLSCIFSEYPDVAWGGWNDRFEGTAMILCYFAAMFFIINSVNSELNIKFIIYPVAAASMVLSALGISQATGHDFFQTTAGQKLLVPNVMNRNGDYPWDLIDQAAAEGRKYLEFTFQNNEIYQTVYNINYVSFYLTLLIPLFAMLFLWSRGAVKKLIWGGIFGVVLFNFFGAASSGGMLGIAISIILIIIILRKKLIEWWRPVLILVAIVVAVGVADIKLVEYNGKGVKWTDELVSAVGGATVEKSAEPGATLPDGADGADATQPTENTAQPSRTPLSHIDWFSNKSNTLTFSIDGNVATMTAYPDGSIKVHDGYNNKGNQIALSQSEGSSEITLGDDRFKNIWFEGQQDPDTEEQFIVLRVLGDDEQVWPFILTGEDKSTLMYRNGMRKNVALENIPHMGFEDKMGFGNGRGYIWSASLPMIKNTILLGYGADTYCIYFPHKDYVGKYNANWNLEMIVDKPHNMYIATAIGTGVISLIALLALFLMYIVQSIRLYWRRKFTTFAEYAGAGIFFGISGFIVSGCVDDSTVSVMPMFYGLLATGIATNIMLKKRYGGALD